MSAEISREFLIPEVTVTDIRMPFWSMVIFMVKWAIASIPALLILIVLTVVFWTVLAGFIASLGRSSRDRASSSSTQTNFSDSNGQTANEHGAGPGRYKFDSLLTGNEHTFCADSSVIARILTQDIVDQQGAGFRKALDRYTELNEARTLRKAVPVKYVTEEDYNAANIVLQKFLLIKPPRGDACWATAAMINARFIDIQSKQFVTVKYGEDPNYSPDENAKAAWTCYHDQKPCYPTH